MRRGAAVVVVEVQNGWVDAVFVCEGEDACTLDPRPTVGAAPDEQREASEEEPEAAQSKHVVGGASDEE